MARVKPGGWTLNEKLSSADITQLDVNTAAVGTTVYETGVRRHETYLDADALRLAPFADGDIVYVTTLTHYQFFASSNDPDDGVRLIRPTAIGPGAPGRWVALSTGIRDVANGVVGLDAQGRGIAGLDRYSTVYRDAAMTTHPNWSRSGNLAVFPSSVVTAPTCKNGDLLIVRYRLAAVDFLGSPLGSFQMSSNMLGAYSDFGGAHRFYESTISITREVTVGGSLLIAGLGAPGPVSVRLTASESVGSPTAISGYANTLSYDIEVIRP